MLSWSTTGFLYAVFFGTPDGVYLLQDLLSVHILPKAVNKVLKGRPSLEQAGQVMECSTAPDYPVVRHPVLVVVVSADLLITEAGTNLKK